ncbi:phenylacetate--CoA ligase [soil metagenome]
MAESDERFLTPEQISGLHDAGIRSAVQYAAGESPYYRNLFRERGIDPARVQGVRDLAMLPFTTKQDIAENCVEFWTCGMDRIADVSTTSGTTGEPTHYPLTPTDVTRLGRNEELSFACAGITPRDIALLAVTMDRCFIAGLAYYEGLRRIGASVIRVGSGPPGLLLNCLQRMSPTVIVSVPSFLLRVSEYAGANGIELKRSSVQRLVCIGEPVRDSEFVLNPLGERLESEWGARVYSTYGVTELASSWCECDAGAGGHEHPELVHTEVVDNEGNALGDGEIGEVVVTPFGVEAMPLLRFRTGDISFLRRERCACGRWTARVGPILGRRGQLMKLKGVSVYPAAVQRVLQGFEQVLDYALLVRSESPLSDELEIVLSLRNGQYSALKSIGEKLQGDLKVRPRLRIESAEALERLQSEHNFRKRQHFIDLRERDGERG